MSYLRWPLSDESRGRLLFADPTQSLPSFDAFLEAHARAHFVLHVKTASRLRWLSNASNSTVSDVVRSLLFIHVYGFVAHHAFLRYVEDWKLAQQRAADELHAIGMDSEKFQALTAAMAGVATGVRFSPVRYSEVDRYAEQKRVSQHGLADEDVDVVLPARLHADFTQCAVGQKTSMSKYARLVLVRQLFGESTNQKWDSFDGV